jgi:hypothetical protein
VLRSDVDCRPMPAVRAQRVIVARSAHRFRREAVANQARTIFLLRVRLRSLAVPLLRRPLGAGDTYLREIPIAATMRSGRSAGQRGVCPGRTRQGASTGDQGYAGCYGSQGIGAADASGPVTEAEFEECESGAPTGEDGPPRERKSDCSARAAARPSSSLGVAQGTSRRSGSRWHKGAK